MLLSQKESFYSVWNCPGLFCEIPVQKTANSFDFPFLKCIDIMIANIPNHFIRSADAKSITKDLKMIFERNENGFAKNVNR